MTFLKAMCVNYQRLLRRLDRKLKDKNQSFCTQCHKNLNATLEHHRKNQATPQQVDLDEGQQQETASASAEVPLLQERPVINEIVTDPTLSKRSKKEMMKSHVNVDDDSPTNGSSRPSSDSTAKRDKKRKRKAEAKEQPQPQGSKGLLTSATMLSVVGLLNYMGNTAAQTQCHGGDGQMFIDQGSNDMNPVE